MQSIDTDRKETLSPQCTEVRDTKPKYWTPPALRTPVLVFTIAICWALIAILEFLLFKSQRDNGLIFAPKINDLPLRRTFLYLYFPTILAVVFSIYWAWIDLETKRMEPYYQLSKKNGALGKDSLLLHYPFSFLPLVPFRAFRDRHWPVFWASVAVVLVTWGLVPTQAGIFSVRSVTRTANMTFDVSTYSMPVEKQATDLTSRYAQSTYGIVALNETLPPYMARNYTLAPFKPRHDQAHELSHGTYTAPTTMYFVDLDCDDASHSAEESRRVYDRNSSGSVRIYKSKKGGCYTSSGPTGNHTVGDQSSSGGGAALVIKQYIGQYIGFHSGNLADYYLGSGEQSACPESTNNTFFAAFSKSKVRQEDPPLGVTAILCRTSYWRQNVSATIDMLAATPLKLEPLAAREPLQWNTFNVTHFETMLSSGSFGVQKVKGNVVPGVAPAPKYWDVVAGTNLSLTSGFTVVQPLVGLALGTGDRPLEEYLDWRTLSTAYTDAYQLIFARAMVEVLKGDSQSRKEVLGLQRLTTEAVLLEVLFVQLVAGFLLLISMASIALLILSFTRCRNLQNDPCTMASVMALVADNQPLLSDLAKLDCCTMEDMHTVVGPERYKLVNEGCGTRLVKSVHVHATDLEMHVTSPYDSKRANPSDIASPVQPVELSHWVVFPFVVLTLALVVFLGTVYNKARIIGLPIPTSNTIVQNLIENYIPTALATLIEPIWIMINRVLCMLQPLEELRNCNARSERSIDTNYSSLPPQLVVFKALKSKHFVLAAVCAMALLANLLAVAFAGLFNQNMIAVPLAASFQPPYSFNFVPINSSVGPHIPGGGEFGSDETSGAYRGGVGEDQFLIAESNYTSRTPLPSWTDDKMFYLPIFSEGLVDNEPNATQFEAVTGAFGATLDCEQMSLGRNIEVNVTGGSASVRASVSSDSGDVLCVNRLYSQVLDCEQPRSALELVVELARQGNSTGPETDVCTGSVILGWIRGPQGLCPVGKNVTLTEEDTLFVLCRPKMLAGTAKIRVDTDGRLVQPADHVKLDDNMTVGSSSLFSTHPINLIGQSTQYVFGSYGNLASWHNESIASDNINYFIRRESNSTRLVDPNLPVPTLEEVLVPLKKVYSKLFSIWLGRNKKNLFIPVTNEGAPRLTGLQLEPQNRLFMSTTMFIISEAILCTYVIVAIWVYARRPGQYLARLPTSIAAQIALFAASTAVQDMQNTSHLDRKGRAAHLERIDARYGYGSFVGSDGRIHVGIEKTPFARPRARKTGLERKLASF